MAENRRQSVKMTIIDPKTGKSVGGSQEDVNVRTHHIIGYYNRLLVDKTLYNRVEI